MKRGLRKRLAGLAVVASTLWLSSRAPLKVQAQLNPVRTGNETLMIQESFRGLLKPANLQAKLNDE
jgi:hypothetical protein